MRTKPSPWLALWLAMQYSISVAQPETMQNPFDLRRLEHGKVNAAPTQFADLQHYALTQLRMVGTIGTPFQRIALLMDQQRHIYLIAQGSKIGPDQGVVQQVTDNGIVLSETWHDTQGQQHERSVRINMDLK